MSQKIIIPKGTIDSTHTTIIEIPNYLHETSTVVVTTPKTADSEPEEAWDGNDYEENGSEHNEGNWEQDYDAQEVTNETPYVTEQQEGYQYAPANEEEGPKVERQADNRPVYPEEQMAPRRPAYPEEQLDPRRAAYPEEQMDPRRPTYQFTENMMRRMLDKKRELAKLRSERQRLLEGEAGTYEVGPQVEDNAANMSEVPENMRARPSPREIEFEKERRRRQMESQRYQSRSQTRQPGYRQGYPKDQSSAKYASEVQNQRYPSNTRPLTQQWNADVHGHPDTQYSRQGQPSPRPQYAQGQVRRPMPQQVMSPEDMRQYQKARRRAMFCVPKI